MYGSVFQRSKVCKQFVDVRFRDAIVQIRYEQFRCTGITANAAATSSSTNQFLSAFEHVVCPCLVHIALENVSIRQIGFFVVCFFDRIFFIVWMPHRMNRLPESVLVLLLLLLLVFCLCFVDMERFQTWALRLCLIGHFSESFWLFDRFDFWRRLKKELCMWSLNPNGKSHLNRMNRIDIINRCQGVPILIFSLREPVQYYRVKYCLLQFFFYFAFCRQTVADSLIYTIGGKLFLVKDFFVNFFRFAKFIIRSPESISTFRSIGRNWNEYIGCNKQLELRRPYVDIIIWRITLSTFNIFFHGYSIAVS